MSEHTVWSEARGNYQCACGNYFYVSSAHDYLCRCGRVWQVQPCLSVLPSRLTDAAQVVRAVGLDNQERLAE